MKDIFEELQAEVDQNVINRKHDEIEQKNLLIANDNLIADCLSKEVFYIATNSELTVSKFTKMHKAHTIVQTRCLELEAELSKLRDKLKYQNLKESFGNDPSPPARDTPDFDSVFVIKKMKASIQGKDNAIKKLRMQISQLKETRSEADRTLDFRTLDFQITQLTEKVTVLQEQNELFRAENEKVKQHYKELYDSIKITRAKRIEQTTALLTENENLKVQIHNKMQCVTTNPVKPRVLAPGKYAIDVEPIPPRNRNNREVHLDYLKHLKENVEILCEIVEEARIEKPLDNALGNACFYTKRSQELLEYVIDTFPKEFNKRDKKVATTPLNRKNQVTFKETCGTSNDNTHKHFEPQKEQKTNVPVIPFTGVISSAEASGSKPRRNTKNNRILPAKSDNKKKVKDHPRNNKLDLKQKNRVDSSISSKRTWKPTGRKFTLGEQCPLTRFTKSKVLPLQRPKHDKAISTSIPITAETQITDASVKYTAVVQIVLWYLDSGRSKHMTGNSSWLKNFVKKFIGTVRFENDHFGAIMGYGDYTVDLEVAFRKHSCYVRNEDGVDLLKGFRGSNLYTIPVEDMMKSSPICLLSKTSKNKSWLGRHRLNHLNFGAINDLAQKDLLRDMPEGVLVLSGLSHVWKSCVCDLVLWGANGNVIGIHDFLCLLEWIGVEVQEEPHLDVRPTLQRLPFYYTPPTATDVVIPDPTPEDLAVGSTTRPSLFVGDDDESDDDDDACVDISLVTPLRSAAVIPSSENQGGSSVTPAAEDSNTRDSGGKGVMVDDAVAPSAGVSRPRPSSRPAPSFRDVSSEGNHTDFFPFSTGPYYATYPKDGVAGNCEFTREGWDAPYQPTFGVLMKEVFKDPVVCKTIVDQFPTPGEMVRVKSLSDDQLTAKMSVLHCMMMSHGGELLARHRGLNQSHHEYVLSADSRLKGYEEKVANMTGLELQVAALKKQVSGLNDKLTSSDASFAKSKAKGKERKKKIRSLTKSLDNLHAEVACISADLNRATILEAKKEECLSNKTSTPSYPPLNKSSTPSYPSSNKSYNKHKTLTHTSPQNSDNHQKDYK
ncbi:hypothetical protein Tco_0911080 [Tanacetum coccineum]|uniref:Retrovirus-related Pol polyprotein from transposon TNT 1-94-like beta-barrel domain-containing protein n=1 Tax=Tanacetum coccineum TaxID=301880 RepID=A0ABQ5CVS5_9ASTR